MEPLGDGSIKTDASLYEKTCKTEKSSYQNRGVGVIQTVLDWETAYGKHPETGENVTLSRMTTEEYVRHPLFKVHGLGVKINAENAFYIYGADIPTFLSGHPWHESFTIAHHTHFDGAILTWKTGIRPMLWGCTLSMARAVFPHEAVSLANIAKLLNLGEKGRELVHFAGKWDLTPADQQVLGGYCINDVELTYEIFECMKKFFPPSELRLIDLTVRLFTEPVLHVERGVLIEEYKRERRRKRVLLKECGTDKSVLASNDKFAVLLLTLGVDPPKKLSPSKVKDGRVDPDLVGASPRGVLPSFRVAGVKDPAERAALKIKKNAYPWAYAFGKQDEEFKLMLDHPDPHIQALVEARMGVKSTIKETRSKRFFKIGTRGEFPVYHKYYGAKTGRDSGGDKQNTTNLNRIDPRDPTSGALRKSLLAPPGHLLCVRDQGQIEARKLAYWAGQEDLLEVFRQGGDPYNRQASKIFGYDVDRKADEFWLEGLVGKSSVLGNGYGMGWGKFQESLRVGFMGAPPLLFDEEAARKLGADIQIFAHQRSYKKGHATLYTEAMAMRPLNVDPLPHLWHCATVKQIVDKYRESNSAVVAGWKEAGVALHSILIGEERPLGKRNLTTTCKEGIRLPNGMIIRYYQLQKNRKNEFKYLSNRRKKEWSYIYGGKVVENIIQALARIVLTDQMLNMAAWLAKEQTSDRKGTYKVVTSTYDEVVCCVPEYRALETMNMMEIEMATAPPWCPDLPLKSSGGAARSYGDCK